MRFIDRRKWQAHLGRLADWQRGDTPAPVTVEWDLSNRCVLGCQDCHFAHTHTRGPWAVRDRALPMAFDPCGDLVDLELLERGLRQMHSAGVRGVIWSGGGEPTTHPDWLKAVVLAARVGLEQGMYTLGGLLTPHTAGVLGHTADWVVVSLDAPDASTYGLEKGVSTSRFHAACDGIRALAETPVTVGVSFLLHGSNAHRTGEMVALARELGATYTTFRPAIRTSPDQPGRCLDDRAWVTAALPALEALEREPDVEIDSARFVEYRDWTGHGYPTCYGVRLATTVTPDGRVWLCPQRRGVAGSCLGDLTHEAFADIWARHAGRFDVDAGCRVMCRLHLMNTELAALEGPRAHEAFV